MRLKEFAASIWEGACIAASTTIIVIIWLLGLVIVFFAVGLFARLAWTGISIVLSSEAFAAVLQSAEATATLISVVVTGICGFGGIMLTNWLSARAAREQAEYSDAKSREDRRENERLARELQIQIAKGLDSRIEDFADAFARYHAETIKAIRHGGESEKTAEQSKGEA